MIKTQLWTPDTEDGMTVIQEVDTEADTVNNVGYIKDGEAVYYSADAESKASAKFKDKYRKNKRIDATIASELTEILTANQYKNNTIVPHLLDNLPSDEISLNNYGNKSFKNIPIIKRDTVNKGEFNIDIDTNANKAELNSKLPKEVKVKL